jgi:hypothetical protein
VFREAVRKLVPWKGEIDMRLRTASFCTVLFVTLCPTAHAAAPTPPAGCKSGESRQFDFWAGRWDVFNASDRTKPIAHSMIERLYAGCGIRENWMPFSGHNGGSLNAYDPATKKWRQFWTDSDGSSALFVGGWTGSAMVIEGVWPQPGKPTQMTRITYTPLSDGSVEQRGVTSDDHGKTWQPGFDLIYRPAGKA